MHKALVSKTSVSSNSTTLAFGVPSRIRTGVCGVADRQIASLPSALKLSKNWCGRWESNPQL